MDPELVRSTFYITYVLLMTTTTITLIEALRTKDIKIRHMLNLETCISIVALFFYGQFIKKVTDPTIDYKSLSLTRYTDWLITTNIMLLVLALFAGFHSGREVSALVYLGMVGLNVVMLGVGYLGESGRMERSTAMIVGFLAFGALFGVIWYYFLRGVKSVAAHALFWFYVVVWGLYGVVYSWEEVSKNVSYNILDLISKVLVGLGIWAYTSKVLVA
jgi:bacteriorhodopsin